MSEKRMPKVGDVIEVVDDEESWERVKVMEMAGPIATVETQDEHRQGYDCNVVCPGDDWRWPADAPAATPAPRYSPEVVALARELFIRAATTPVDNPEATATAFACSALEYAEAFYAVVNGAGK